MLKEELEKRPDVLDVESRLIRTNQRKELVLIPTEKAAKGASFEGKGVKLTFRYLKDCL